jgi:membrane fusion protein, heavy metal efflux system
MIRMVRGAALLAAVAVTACSKAPVTTADSAKAVSPSGFTITEAQRQRIHVVTVEPVTFRPVVEATGTVAFNGNKSTQVLSPVSGPVIRVIGDVGMNVTKGQPLAYVASPDFASAVANYRKAQNAYRQAKRVADRDSALFKNDALARADLEQAQADLAAADADVESAVQAMRSLGVEDSQIDAIKDGKTAAIQAIIRAPIDGTVVEKLIAEGQLLEAGSTATFTVADLNTMWVMANIFANDLHDVGVGQSVDVITPASSTPIAGKVDYIASMADPATNAVLVRVLVPNQNRALRRDMFVQVQVKSTQEHRGLLVPTSSVMRDDQNLPYVYIVNDKNGYNRRRVDLGKRVGDQYEITNGLAAGDKVVAEGALFLQFSESQ